MPLDYTVGGPAANSYASIAEADEFAASDLGRFAKSWIEATAEKKEAALRRATAEIDSFVGIPEEERYAETQALSFPRYLDVNSAGTLIIPTRVKRATYLQAAYLLAAADQIDDAALRRAKGFTNYANPDGTAGSLSNDRSFGRMHPDAESLLGGFDSGAVIGRIVLT